MTMFALDKSESTSLLMPGTYWRPQWILCSLKVVGPALCVTHTLHSMESICCDGCLDWVHLKCTGLKRAPKSKHWFCRACLSM